MSITSQPCTSALTNKSTVEFKAFEKNFSKSIEEKIGDFPALKVIINEIR